MATCEPQYEAEATSVYEKPNSRIREFAPRLRPDLVFRPQQVAGQTIYIVEDPVQTRFFRLGRNEYLLAAMFDGQTIWKDALANVNQLLDEEELSEQQARTIINWAAQNELLEPDELNAPATARPAANSNRGRRGGNSPLVFRVPLGNPDAWIAKCYPYLAWIYSKWATFIGMSMVVIGLATIVHRWNLLVESTSAIFSPMGQLSLLVAWVVLKAIHELSHGLACHRYGGTVRETGLQFILMLPIAYVDVTSSWRIRSRWQRLHIAAAGMQLELYVASLAALVWSFTSPGILNQFCANLVFMAGVTTIAFNANPLMRFDGYYILTDLLDMPNLAVTAQSWLRAWARHFFLGLYRENESNLDGRTAFTRIYAVLAFSWRIVVCVGLIAAAATMWHGAGVVLAAFALVAWFGVPLLRLIQLLVTPTAQTVSMRWRLATTTTALGIVGTIALLGLPWPGAQNVVGFVDYEPLTVVRTDTDGFVEQVLVRSGDVVKRGQELAHLRNDTLRRDHAIQKARVKASQLRIRRLLGQKKLAALAAEREQLASFQKQLAELDQQVAGLTLRAPATGQVVSRNLDSQIGTYLSRGEPLLQIGNEDEKTVSFSVPQREISHFRENVQTSATISLATGGRFLGQVDRVAPRASLEPLDPALCAIFGGPLPVRQKPVAPETTEHSPQWELLEPHFTARVELSRHQSKQLQAGQRVPVLLGTPRESLGAHLWNLLDDKLLRSNASLSL